MHVQIFDSDNVISIYQFTGELVKKIVTLMLGFCIQCSDLLLLLSVIGRSFFHMRQFTLFFGQSVLGAKIRVWCIHSVSIGIYVECMHGHIQPYSLIRINIIYHLFLCIFEKQCNIVFTIWFSGYVEFMIMWSFVKKLFYLCGFTVQKLHIIF